MNKKRLLILILGLICFLNIKASAFVSVKVRFFSDAACDMSLVANEEKGIPRLTWGKNIDIENDLQLEALKKIDKSKIPNNFSKFYEIINIIKEIADLNLKEEAMIRGRERFVEKEYNKLCAVVENKEKLLNEILISYIEIKQGFLF